MKQIIFACFASVLLFACGSKSKPDADSLTADDKNLIEVSLGLHNTRAAHAYEIASIHERFLFEANHFGEPKGKVEPLLKAHMDSFDAAWNVPYTIAKDSTVNIEKYLQYCKEQNANPKEEHLTLPVAEVPR